MALKIGNLAVKTGTSTPTIRYYEEIGLLPRPSRQQGGQRSYGQEDVRRLTFIRRCREFGFSIDRIRELASLMHDPGRSCLEAKKIAQSHLKEVRAKLAELKALERSMSEFVSACETSCAGGPGPECEILGDLSR